MLFRLSDLFKLLFLMLCTQQVFGVWPDPPPANASCPQLQTDCTASMAALSQGREFRGSCTPEKWSDSEYKVSFQCQWVGQENSWISCYNHMCTVPLCSNGEILNTSTFTCEGGTTSTSNPPVGTCEGPACCVDGYTWNAITKGCDKNPDTPTNTYNPQATECALEWDACIASMANKEGFTCFRSRGETVIRTSSGSLAAGADMGASICLYSSFTNSSVCSVCGKNTTYSVDKDGVIQNTMGDGSSTSSGSWSSGAPGLDKRKEECAAQGGKWDYVSDQTVKSDDLYREYWKCTTASGTTSFGGNGGIIPNKGTQTQQQQNLNCGGTTGISCESTQLQSLGALNKISTGITSIVDFFKIEQNPQLNLGETTLLDAIPEYVRFKQAIDNISTVDCGSYATFFSTYLKFSNSAVQAKVAWADTAFCKFLVMLRYFILAVVCWQSLLFIVD